MPLSLSRPRFITVIIEDIHTLSRVSAFVFVSGHVLVRRTGVLCANSRWPVQEDVADRGQKSAERREDFGESDVCVTWMNHVAVENSSQTYFSIGTGAQKTRFSESN